MGHWCVCVHYRKREREFLAASPAPNSLVRPLSSVCVSQSMWVASDLVLEESPKWHLLKMVLEEVRKEMKATGEQEETEQAGGLTGRRVLVVVNDERTCYQLKQVPSPLSLSLSLSHCHCL